jgi:hypothetical protein
MIIFIEGIITNSKFELASPFPYYINKKKNLILNAKIKLIY